MSTHPHVNRINGNALDRRSVALQRLNEARWELKDAQLKQSTPITIMLLEDNVRAAQTAFRNADSLAAKLLTEG